MRLIRGLLEAPDARCTFFRFESGDGGGDAATGGGLGALEDDEDDDEVKDAREEGLGGGRLALGWLFSKSLSSEEEEERAKSSEASI